MCAEVLPGDGLEEGFRLASVEGFGVGFFGGQGGLMPIERPGGGGLGCVAMPGGGGFAGLAGVAVEALLLWVVGVSLSSMLPCGLEWVAASGGVWLALLLFGLL